MLSFCEQCLHYVFLVKWMSSWHSLQRSWISLIGLRKMILFQHNATQLTINSFVTQCKSLEFKLALLQKEPCGAKPLWNVNLLKGLLSDTTGTLKGKLIFLILEYNYVTWKPGIRSLHWLDGPVLSHICLIWSFMGTKSLLLLNFFTSQFFKFFFITHKRLYMSVSHKKSKIKVKDNSGCTSPLFDGSDLFQRLTAAVNSHGIHLTFFERKRHTVP